MQYLLLKTVKMSAESTCYWLLVFEKMRFRSAENGLARLRNLSLDSESIQGSGFRV